ncbi:MAG: hypothetical protein J6S14_20885 [Clostridia bacterium]|nr:hypothetical protein [Clostridia bacterium]
MTCKYPIKVTVLFPAECWPKEMLSDQLDKSDESAYSFEEIAVLMALCTDANTMGICRASVRLLLERLNISVSQTTVERYTQIVDQLLKRCSKSDSVRLEAVVKPVRHKDDFQVRIAHRQWKSCKSRFFTLSNVEFEQIVACAAKHNQKTIVMLAIYMVLKSAFYTTDVGGRRLTAGIVAKGVLAQRCGVSAPTVDAYVASLEQEHIISHLSGKTYGASNVYCLAGHEAALDVLMKKQLDFLAAKSAQTYRFGIKRFEGIY